MAPPAPTGSSISLGSGGRLSAGPIFLGAQGREGSSRGGTQVQLQVSSSPNNQMQKRRKEPPGRQVTQCRWASLVTWMAASGSWHIRQGAVPSPPAVHSRAIKGSAARQPPRAQGCLAGGSGGGLQPPSARRRAPPPPRTPAHFGISPLNPQAATCSNVAWQF